MSLRLTPPPYGELQFTSLRFRFVAAEEKFLFLLVPETPQTVAAMTRMARAQRAGRRKTPSSHGTNGANAPAGLAGARPTIPRRTEGAAIESD